MRLLKTTPCTYEDTVDYNFTYAATKPYLISFYCFCTPEMELIGV